MSAFIISTNCMTKCVQAIMEHADQIGSHTTLRYSPGLPLARYDEQGQKIGTALYAMNHLAVLARYPGDTEYAEIPEWTFKMPTKRIGLEDALKMLDCLQYQCSEGDVPDCKLYQDLTTVINQLAGVIARATLEYHRAPWD